MSLPSGQTNDEGSGIDQGDLPDNGRPARERRPLEAKEQEDAAKEAFDGGALAQFFLGPGRWQAGAVLLAFGVPGDNGHGSQRGMDPADQLQSPIACIQPDNARADVVEAHGQFEQGAGKRAIMCMSWPDQEVYGQAGTATEQRMHAIATQERTRMVSGSVTHSGIGIGSTPRQDRGAIDDQIAGSDHSAVHGSPDCEHKEGLKERGSSCLPAFAQLGRAGNARLTIVPQRQATGQGQRGPAREPVMYVPRIVQRDC